jgi:alkylation response protein AidB-like acyl-CoA dehydrogenase
MSINSKLPELPSAPSCDAIAEGASLSAAERDNDGDFPEAAFDALRRFGLVSWPPLGGGEARRLLRLLASVGRGDLNVGRIFEGHVNAIFLIRQFGTVEQNERYAARASLGELFGVWNTDLPEEPLGLIGGRLHGKKTFASGIEGLSHAIVTVSQPLGRLMIVVPVEGLTVDRSWWRPLGMRASGSHIVDFTGLKIEPNWVLGDHGDYIREPWFSAGAIRFVAVHVGGMHALLDAAVAHLARTDRLADPYQRQRLGRMGTAVEGGYAWLDRAGTLWREAVDQGPGGEAETRVMTFANAARGAVESLALRVLEEAERGVGVAGMIAPHPVERLVRNLRTYLRQPNPDGALTAVGQAIADGIWRPGYPSREGPYRVV